MNSPTIVRSISGAMAWEVMHGSVMAMTVPACITSTGAGGYIAGGVGVTDILVTNNKFVGNATGNKNKGGALYLDYRCPAIFVDNLIANNFAGSGSAISCFNTSSPLFLNTTIVNNTTSYISTIALDQSSSPIFKNCIFSGDTNGSGKEIGLTTGCAPTFDHCNVQSGLTSYLRWRDSCFYKLYRSQSAVCQSLSRCWQCI